MQATSRYLLYYTIFTILICTFATPPVCLIAHFKDTSLSFHPNTQRTSFQLSLHLSNGPLCLFLHEVLYFKTSLPPPSPLPLPPYCFIFSHLSKYRGHHHGMWLPKTIYLPLLLETSETSRCAIWCDIWREVSGDTLIRVSVIVIPNLQKVCDISRASGDELPDRERLNVVLAW